MRVLTGGVAHIASTIEDDLIARDLPLFKGHIEAIADLCASALTSRCASTAEWISVLPRKIDEKSKERYISRLLSDQARRSNVWLYTRAYRNEHK